MGNSQGNLNPLRVGPLGNEKGYRTTIKEEDRMSNDVPYKFNLLQKGWFGSYECRVHRSLLDSPSKRIEAEPFAVHIHDGWCFGIEHTDEGHLIACIWSEKCRHKRSVICSITVLNQSSGKRHRFGGDNRTFERSRKWKCDLGPVSEIADPKAGFLFGDSFVIRADLRPVLQKNDKDTLSTDTRSANYTWELNDLMEQGPLMMKSPVFTVANHEWQLRIHPYGQEHGASHASVYVACVDGLADPVRAKYRISLLNHRSSQKTVSEEATVTFCQESATWGSHKFIEIKSLQDQESGFIEDGWITLTVNIEALENKQKSRPKQRVKPRAKPRQNEEPVCVYCLGEKQTSGVLHGKTTHKCLCSDCIKILEREKFPCPVCGQKVDKIIYKFF